MVCNAVRFRPWPPSQLLANTTTYQSYPLLQISKTCIAGVHLESKLPKSPRCSVGTVDSIQAISSVTGFDRKTVRKYLPKPDVIPAYGARPPLPGKLDNFKPYLEERLKAGV